MNNLKHILKRLIRYTQTPLILRDWMKYKKAILQSSKAGTPARFSLNISDAYPCVKDKTITTGFDRHYVFHTAWAARKVKEINPAFHTDISSSLYFCGIVSAFIPVKFYDYRPAELNLSNLESKPGNLMNLPFEDNSLESISCMHTIEHIGLGRYGDPIDPEADLKAIRELIRVTKPGGSILFVTPIGGTAKIEYNAHRIYTYAYIVEYFKDLELVEFSLIPENVRNGRDGQNAQNGGILINATKSQADAENYGCGCFWFKKKIL